MQNSSIVNRHPWSDILVRLTEHHFLKVGQPLEVYGSVKLPELRRPMLKVPLVERLRFQAHRCLVSETPPQLQWAAAMRTMRSERPHLVVLISGA